MAGLTAPPTPLDVGIKGPAAPKTSPEGEFFGGQAPNPPPEGASPTTPLVRRVREGTWFPRILPPSRGHGAQAPQTPFSLRCGGYAATTQ
ncbi:MAG: hypothetical protein EI684_13115 [Candidatus Viridilinea halotolerans]|uniref:Uncharacterized protein n=1 Tax=Candidatus Viridilinea halotolerans TaxID=2491704 RepID=A0A426TY32_9CHLR|nr:MAG: hypothetical protein EI684_13115 [Candidatus Viridilinea halotolerans]